jgi:hypothetical protein
MPQSSDGEDIPEVSFIKDGSFEQLTRCTRFLRNYGAGWRAVLFNSAALIVVALTGGALCLIVGADFAKWPWWIYPVVLVLVLISIYFVRNLFVYLYDSIRWLPDAIQFKRSKSLLMLRWRGENLAHGNAEWDKAMKEIQENMDPKDVEELRKDGFL